MNKTFPIELSEGLHKRIKIAAIHEGLTLHDWVIKTLQEKVGDDENRRENLTKQGGNNERGNRSR